MSSKTLNGPSSSAPLPALSEHPADVYIQPIAAYSCGGRVRIAALLNSEASSSFIGKHITVCGFSRSVRKQGGGSLCFVVLSDGSSSSSLQVVVENNNINNFDLLLKCGAGCSFRFKGMVVESPAKGQKVELQVRDPERGDSVEILGCTDSAKYPLSKKEHSREFLREIAHLRPRTNLISAVMRIRSQLAMATHKFFQDRGFLYIHTPIITASDCEGAGEMFSVSTLLPEGKTLEKNTSEKNNKTNGGENPEKKNFESNDISSGVCGGNSEKKTKDGPQAVIPLTKEGEVDYTKDFFSRHAYLTVSGQLAVEPFCCSLSDVYTFGPTFRAENSHTSRHLAEFWMVEPEIAFADLNDNMDVAEAYVKFCVKSCISNCSADIDWFEKNQEEGLRARLENILAAPFARVTYTEAVSLLQQHEQQHQQQQQQQQQQGEGLFKEKVEWGMDLGSEHERYLTEQIYKKPVIVYNYPKDIKAFYMKLNEDGKTVRAMDLLVPKIGELVGGSQREEQLDKLDNMIKQKNLDINSYWWYRELRQYGTIPHAGFGLGFERLVMLVTGIDNIRDTIPYPRYPGHAEF